MTQTITTDLAALATKPNEAIHIFNDRLCAACGGDLVEDADRPSAVFCGTCFAADLAPVQATLAALAWAKAAGHEVDEISVSEWTHEEYDHPPIPIPGRVWYVDMEVVEGVCPVRCPLYVVQQADGSMQVVPDDFPRCRFQGIPTCDAYILTEDTGVRRCPEHGEVTAWNMPATFYLDDPETLAQDTADFARLGTVQWFDDYPEDDEDADGE